MRPTLLPYTELYHWDGCASFVSDYLTMEPLKCPLTPVRKGLQFLQKQPHDGGERRTQRGNPRGWDYKVLLSLQHPTITWAIPLEWQE